MIHDLRLATRLLLKSPAFTLVAVLTLGLGIGANTAIFSFINAFFLRAMPVRAPDELVALFTTDERAPGSLPMSQPNFADYEAQNQVFGGMASYTFTVVNTVVNHEPARLTGQMVSGNYFDLLGVRAALGRTFRDDEWKTPGQNPAVVLSYNTWRTQFAGDPGVLGRPLVMNGVSFAIIGVAPAEFRGLNTLGQPAFWVTHAAYRTVLSGIFLNYFENNRRALIMSVVARLKPGVTLEQAQASLKPIADELARQYPQPNRGRSVQLLPLAQAGINPGARANFVLAGVLLLSLAGLVLLITCGNLANLLLARATARQREVALRLSLGAARGRLIRQLLTESLLLSALGGLTGIVLAYWTKDLLWSLRPPFFPQDFVVALDARVLAYALGVTLLTGLLFGLAPAWTATRPELAQMLKEDAKGSAPQPLFSVRNFLVAGQLTLSVIALIVAGLFIRSLGHAQNLDLGWNSRDLGLLSVATATQGYDGPRTRDYIRRAVERLSSAPGITSVFAANNALMQGGGNRRTVMPQGSDEKMRTQGQLLDYLFAAPGFFQSLGMQLVAGRDFTPADDLDHPRVVIVNQSFAKLGWPGEDALGKTLKVFGSDRAFEVVGVLRDATYNNIGEAAIPYALFPLAQDDLNTGAVTFHVRTSTDITAQLPMLRRELQAIDPAMPLANVTTMEDNIRQGLWGARTGAALLTVFGVLALALSAIGVYSIVSYTVGQRTREIGIRMAIGAQAGDVLAMVFKRGLLVAGAGIVVGVVAAFVITRLFQNLLYGISASDPLTFLLITALLGTVAAAACFFPARRATKIDPLVALRND